MPKKAFAILFLFFSIGTINCLNNSLSLKYTTIRLFINPGIAYHFPITTDYSTIDSTIFMEIPLNINVDIRSSDWISLLTGIEFSYGINYQKLTLDEEKYAFYLHNLFIKIPLLLKIYPMVKKHDAYYNFFFGIGGFLHFCPLSLYLVYTESNLIHSGNIYRPSHSEMPPGNIYTPVNLGFRFSVGNHFYISNKMQLGIELFSNYLLIPPVNGYYFGMNYRRGSNVIMDFDLSVGVVFCFGIILLE